MSVPIPLYSIEQTRAIEQSAIASGIDGYALMQRAGAAAWTYLQKRWPKALRIGVLCGPGNNGGDGLVLAKLAKDAGRDVRVVMLSAASPAANGDAAQAFVEWQACGGQIQSATDLLPVVDLWIDALFGIGLGRPILGVAEKMITALNASGVPIFALDVPSGLNAQTGRCSGVCVRATATMTFIVDKVGLHTGQARAVCGDVICADLFVPENVIAAHRPTALLAQSSLLAYWFAPRPRDAHKGKFGHALIIGGDLGMAGAARLAAEAALRCGAGLVSVATRSANVAGWLAACPEAMVHGVDDSSELAPLLARASVVAIGPGLGKTLWGSALLNTVMQWQGSRVFDADALNMLAMQKCIELDTSAILTPHPMEAARLLDADVVQIENDRLAAAMQLVDRFHCNVILKGAGSIVAGVDHTPMMIDAGNPGMAGGGMGDVLTGVAAACMAQGLSGFHAACAAALAHASAGDLAAANGGERGMLASDLFAQLRHVVNQ